MNIVILLGNLTRDPELRFTQGGKGIATFGLAVNHRYKAADGTMKDDPTFVDCEAWGATAENIQKFFVKGRKIAIQGRLKLDQWDDKTSGQRRSKLKVVVDTFHFADSGDKGASKPQPQRQAQPQPKDTMPVIGEDDIPF